MNNNNSEPQLLSKDVIAKRIKDYLIWLWEEDLKQAKSADKHEPTPDTKNWIDDGLKALDAIRPLETYEEITNYYSEYMSYEGNGSEAVRELLWILVER